MYTGAAKRHAMPFVRYDHKLVAPDEGKRMGIAQSEHRRLPARTDCSFPCPVDVEFSLAGQTHRRGSE